MFPVCFFLSIKMRSKIQHTNSWISFIKHNSMDYENFPTTTKVGKFMCFTFVKRKDGNLDAKNE